MTANISTKFVPFEGDPASPIWFIGEAPGATEEMGSVDHPMPGPFIGDSGSTIFTPCLLRNGIQRPDGCFVANLSHFRPKDNRFEYLLGTPELTESIAELVQLAAIHKPTVICALGNWPLWFITGKQGKKIGSGIMNWRGSILSALPSFGGIKVIPTIHPAAVYRERKNYPIFDQDIKRVIFESTFRDLRLPERKFIIAPMGDELEHYTQILTQSSELSVDIETFGPNIACVGFSPSADLSVCIVYDEHSAFVRDSLNRILQSNAKKIFHFGTFDTAILKAHGYEVKNFHWDTMVAQSVIAPELPRALKFLASMYTREPYYKDEGKETLGKEKKSWGQRTDRTKLWRYNCKDTAVTFEIYKKQMEDINDGPKAWMGTFLFMMDELELAAYISEQGMLEDQERRELIELCTLYKYVKDQSVLEKLSYEGFNVGSHQKVMTFLYDVLKLPERRKQNGKRTADEDSLVSLLAVCKGKIHESKKSETIDEWRRKFLVAKLIIQIRGYLKLLSSYIKVKISDDGRIRSTYKVPATETGRWSAEKYVDGTGVNAMTFPRDYIEVPDDIEEFKKKINPELVEANLPEDDDSEDEDEEN